MRDVDARMDALEREVRRLRRVCVALGAMGVLLGGGAIVACKSKAKPMTKLTMEQDGRKLEIEADGITLTAGESWTTVRPEGLFVTRTDPNIGERSANVSGGLVSSSSHGSMAQVTADSLGAQVLITDTKNASAELRASQGIGGLRLSKDATRIEIAAHEAGGSARLESGSEAELVADPESAELLLRTGQQEKRMSSLDKR